MALALAAQSQSEPDAPLMLCVLATVCAAHRLVLQPTALTCGWRRRSLSPALGSS
jgi:hypothetical protein